MLNTCTNSDLHLVALLEDIANKTSLTTIKRLPIHQRLLLKRVIKNIHRHHSTTSSPTKSPTLATKKLINDINLHHQHTKSSNSNTRTSREIHIHSIHIPSVCGHAI